MEETLRKFGLSQSEAKIYLVLVELGASLAGDVTKKANINRSNCYDALQRLIEKGLCSYIIKSNRKYFKAETPQKFLELIKEQKNQLEDKEKEIKKIIPKLIEKSRKFTEEPEAEVYKGKKGIKSIFEDILKYNENWVFGSGGKFKEILGPFFSLYQKQIIKKNIKVKLIVSKGTSKNITTHAETRYLPKGYESLISTIVYNKKVATIIWTENPVGFLIESKEAANSYRRYFKVMWQTAKH